MSSSKKSAVIMVLLFLCVAGVVGVLVFVFMNPLQSEDTKQANVLRKKIDTSQTSRAITDTVASDKVKALDKRLGRVEEKLSELGKLGEKITQFEEQTKNIELLMGKIDRLEAAIISTMDKKTEVSSDPGEKQDKKIEPAKIVPVEATVEEISDKPKKKVFKRKPAKKRTVTRRRKPVKRAPEQAFYGSSGLIYYPNVGSGEETPEEEVYAGYYMGRSYEKKVSPEQRSYSRSYEEKASPGQRSYSRSYEKKASPGQSYYTGQKTGRGMYHLVRPGETIADISRRYGMRVSDLRQLNNIKPGIFVYPGEMVLVKPSSGRSREVSAGSAGFRFGGTLNQISRRYAPTYGMSEKELRRYEKLAPGLAVYSD
ncbi:MAG: LysM peptidoglycan-binding domain-containing protein [Desulfobacterales bacterium]|nr:LysM peptidoglycan-binding domain-containing protein [Desulfobacterales bacterium]